MSAGKYEKYAVAFAGTGCMWYGIDMTHNQVVRMVCNDLIRLLLLFD